MKRLLIIGGSGAIGQSILPYFDNEEFTVYSCDSQSFPLPNIPGKIFQDADIVINLAGLSLLNDLSGYHILNKKLIDISCLGSVNILAHFLPGMRERKFGRLIFMSSVCSVINLPLHGIYSASKAFIDKLVKIAAIENAQYGITVNSIQLGYTGVGMGDPEQNEKMRNKPSLKRFVTPREIFDTIMFIISTEYYTGQNLRLDGGIK